MTAESWGEARALLGVEEAASAEELRAAYMEKVRQHPPDRDPEVFEKIRDAYDQLRDPRLKAQQVLVGRDIDIPLVKLVDAKKSPRKFVGPAPWLEVLKERRS